jgi:hypothetical protein
LIGGVAPQQFIEKFGHDGIFLTAKWTMDLAATADAGAAPFFPQHFRG